MSYTFGNDRDKELLLRVVTSALAHVAWWTLEVGPDGESSRFAGGFAGGATVDVDGSTLRECLERTEEALREQQNAQEEA